MGRLAAAALQAAIAVPTVSSNETRLADPQALKELQSVLAQHFPALFAAANFTQLTPSGALLGRVEGNSTADPLVLMAHQDVVAAEHPEDWTHPPFAGTLADGFVWGRGALDCKGILVAICAAADHLLSRGQRPTRDVWFSFGSNEEVSGDGAQAAVDELQRQGVRPWLILDEGGAIIEGALPGVSAQLAVVGVAEKGTVDLELVARSSTAGHASTPGDGGATTILAKAITRLQTHRFPARLPAPTREMFKRVAPHATGPLASVYRHVDSLAKPLAKVMARLGRETEALARTTVAITRLSGSSGQNVLAAEARAGINMRVAVGETAAEAIAYVQRVIKDRRIEVRTIDVNDPSPTAALDAGFDALGALVSQCFPGTVTVPYVMLGASDARFFQRVWPQVYRFSPIKMTTEQRMSVHGVDERIGVADLAAAVDWYEALMKLEV